MFAGEMLLNNIMPSQINGCLVHSMTAAQPVAHVSLIRFLVSKQSAGSYHGRKIL